MVTKQQCPRRAEGPGIVAGATPDQWDRRSGRRGPRSCSYCGSVHPDDFMTVVRDGTATLGTTDKSYKVYVEGLPGFAKFYFQHLSSEQRDEFIDLYNARTVLSFDEHPHHVGKVRREGTSLMRVGYPGYFNPLPFFATLVK